jgi:hypothetical protein
MLIARWTRDYTAAVRAFFAGDDLALEAMLDIAEESGNTLPGYDRETARQSMLEFFARSREENIKLFQGAAR